LNRLWSIEIKNKGVIQHSQGRYILPDLSISWFSALCSQLYALSFELSTKHPEGVICQDIEFFMIIHLIMKKIKTLGVLRAFAVQKDL